MALTYDQISAITQKKFIPKLYDNIFDSNPLLQRWKKKCYEKIDGGTSILVPLNYATTSASAWYSGAETLDTTDNDVMTAAEYSWKQIHATVSINRADELKNSGDSQILALVKNKVKIAEHTLLDAMGTGIYNAGTNAKAIGGLQLVMSTSNTVGGIAQSTYSWWQPKLDTTTTTLSIPAMQGRFTALTVDSNKPTVIAGSRANYDRYYNLLQPQQRFMDSGTADGGFESLMFNGAPFIPDSHAPSGQIEFLNEDYVHLFVHKDEDFRFEPFAKPINQNVKVSHIYWMGALGFSNLRLLGALTAITA